MLMPEVGITITANDLTSPAFDSASKNLGSLETKYKALAPNLQKSTMAMAGFAQAAGALPGPLGSVIGKISSLATMLTGPVGIAMAAITLAVGAATAVWQVYEDEQQTIIAGQKAVEEVFQRSSERLKDQKKAVGNLAQEFQFFGVDQQQKVIELKEKEIEGNERGLSSAERDIEIKTKQLDLLRQTEKASEYRSKEEAQAKINIGLMEEEVAALRKIRDASYSTLDARREDLAIAKDLQFATKQQADIDKAADEAKRKRIERERDALTAARSYAEAEKAHGLEYIRQEREKQNAISESNRLYVQYSAAGMDLANQRAASEVEFQDALQKDDATVAKAAEAFTSLAMGISGAMGAAFRVMIDGSENAGVAMMKAVVRAAQVAVQAYIAQGMAAAAASAAAMPIIGWIAAGAAAAVVGGLIEGFMAKIPKAATGGLVRSRSVMEVGERGPERILSNHQTGLFERMVGALENTAGRQPAFAGAGGGVTQINNFSSLIPVTSSDTSRATRELKRSLNRV